MHVLIENAEILESYKGNFKDSVVITEDPYTYERLKKDNVETLSMSSILSRDKVQEVSSLSARLSYCWVQALNQLRLDTVPFAIEFGDSMNTIIYNLLSTGFYRYEQLRKIKDSFNKTVIPVFDIQEPREQILSIHRNNLLVKIAGIPEFRDSFCIIDLKDVSIPYTRPYHVIKQKKLAYLKHYLLSICAESTFISVYCNGKFIKKEKVFKNIISGNNRMSIKILTDGPMITKLMFSLLFKGAKIRYVTYEALLKNMVIKQRDLGFLKNSLVASCNDLNKFENVDQYRNLFDLLADKVIAYLERFLLPVTDVLCKESQQRTGLNNGTYGSVIFMGTRDPVSSIISSIYSYHGIPTILFQEGAASCLMKSYRELVPLGYINGGHAFVSGAPYEELYFKKKTKKYFKPFYTFGTNEILRPPFQKTGRFIARSIWDIPVFKGTIIYFPTRYRRSVVRPSYDFFDIDYWKYQKQMILNVFSKIQKDVFIKIHKKGLLTTPDERKYPMEIIELPQNVKVKESPDMRFIRLAGDLLVVDAATATLSWAVTSNVPVIYMNHEKSPLEDEVYEAMKSALFLIDVKADNKWENELMELLSMPLPEIKKRWQEMEEKRGKFKRYYLTGVKKGKKDFYRWMQYISELGVDSLRKRNKQLPQADNSISIYHEG